MDSLLWPRYTVPCWQHERWVILRCSREFAHSLWIVSEPEVFFRLIIECRSLGEEVLLRRSLRGQRAVRLRASLPSQPLA